MDGIFKINAYRKTTNIGRLIKPEIITNEETILDTSEIVGTAEAQTETKIEENGIGNEL